MAKNVSEIMNRELFSLRPEDAVDDAMGYLVALGITGAPVVDEEGYVVGVIAMRDLARARGGTRVADRMSQPAVTVYSETLVRDAARVMADTGYHRVPVVTQDGHASGMVSIIDVVRAMLGVPVSHPPTFPHYDTETGLVWSDDALLDLEHAEQAPNGPGILVLRIGGPFLPESDIWVEAVNDVRARVDDLIGLPQPNRRLRGLLERHVGNVRFRAASVPDAEQRAKVVDSIRRRIEDWTRPAERARA